MRSRGFSLGATIVALALGTGGCGGGDEPADPAEPAGATGAPGVEGSASYDITVADFIAELQPQKEDILEEFVGTSEACQGVEVDPGFVLLVSAKGIEADPASPLPDLVEEQC